MNFIDHEDYSIANDLLANEQPCFLFAQEDVLFIVQGIYYEKVSKFLLGLVLIISFLRFPNHSVPFPNSHHMPNS